VLTDSQDGRRALACRTQRNQAKHVTSRRDIHLGAIKMKKAVAPISLAGSKLGEVRHVCAFFNSDDEE